MTHDKIEYVAIGDLTPWKRNARTHSKKQIRQIAESIEVFGFTNPVLIDEARTILAGHGRVEAAKLLGLGEVPLSAARSHERRREAGLCARGQQAGAECGMG